MEKELRKCKIHGDITEDEIYAWSYKGRNYRRCKHCISDKNKRYHQRIKPVKNKKDREYWESQKSAIKQRRNAPESKAKRQEWCQKNKEKITATATKNQRIYRKELSDSYVKKILIGNSKNIKHSDIPESLVNFKRTVMLFKRELKKKGGEKVGNE